MSAIRPHPTRFSAFLLVLASLVAAPARPAQAAEFHFRKVFTLSQADLQDFDALGSFWFFDRGRFLLDVDASISSNGNCFVAAAGAGSGFGLNFKLGAAASLSVLFFEFADCHIDRIDGVLRAKIPFCLELFPGGKVPSEMRLAITPSDVTITGVTIDTARLDP